MPQSPLPADVISLPETLTKFREHAQKGNYALAQRYHEQVRRSSNRQRYTMSEELAGLACGRIRRVGMEGCFCRTSREIEGNICLAETPKYTLSFAVSSSTQPCCRDSGYTSRIYDAHVSRTCCNGETAHERLKLTSGVKWNTECGSSGRSVIFRISNMLLSDRNCVYCGDRSPHLVAYT